MKLCIDCKHYSDGYFLGSRCRRSLSDRRSPVSGKPNDKLFEYAWREREPQWWPFGQRRCGPDAFYFEAR